MEKEQSEPTEEQPIRVERYSDKYKEQVIELINQVMEIEFGTHSKSGRPDIRNIPEYYQKIESGDFWMALDENNNVVGTIGLSDYGKGDGILERFNVKEGLRGKGIGTKLYSQLMDFAEAHEYRRIFLGTSENRKEALKFYKKRGFEEVPKNQIPEQILERVGKDPLQMMLNLNKINKLKNFSGYHMITKP